MTEITDVLSLMSLTTGYLLLCVVILLLVVVSHMGAKRGASVTPTQVEEIATRLPGPRGLIATTKVRISMLKEASKRMFLKTKEYGKMFGIGTDNDTYVIIMDHTNLEEAFITKSDVFCDRGGVIKSMLESGIQERGSIFNNGAAWHESRGFISQTTKNNYFGATIIAGCINDTIPFLYSELDSCVGKPFDPKRIYQYFFIDVFHRIAFGVGINYEDGIVQKFVKDLDDVVAQTLDPSVFVLARPSAINSYFFKGYRSQLQSSAGYLKARAEEQLTDRADTSKKNPNPNKNNLIQLFASYIEGIRSAGKASYADPDDGWVIVYEMFFAAADTVHEVLLWLTLFLATRMDIQDKMRTEINNLVDYIRGDISYDHRSRLPIVRSVILEVLRMRPVAPMGVPHIASERGTIDGYNVPKGSQIFPNIWGMHNDPDLWENPDVFNPDRFLSNAGVLNEEKAKLVIPFSIGPRSCPGEQIARRTIFHTLVSLVCRYRMTLPATGPPSQLVNEKRSFTMSPKRYKVVFSTVQPKKLEVNKTKIRGNSITTIIPML